MSDERVAIDATARVRGLSRPIGFGRAPVIGAPDGYVVRPPPLVDPGSPYMVVVPPEHVIERAPAVSSST